MIKLTIIVGQVIAAIWSIFFIPSVQTSVYFHRKINAESSDNAFELIWRHFKTSYTNMTVVVWSVYYTISFCLFFQIFAYIQVLWLDIQGSNAFWNGAVDSLYTALAGIITLMTGKIQISYLRENTKTMMVLIVMSMLQGIIVYFAAVSATLIQCYIMFILYGVFYSFSITICATKIAESISEDSYGLVFGINTFLALVVQTFLILTVVSNGFMLSPSGQYIVYACIYFGLGFFYAIKMLIDKINF